MAPRHKQARNTPRVRFAARANEDAVFAEGRASELWDRVAKRATGCWEWTGGVNSGGYGSMRLGPKRPGGRPQVRPHRFAYYLANGPIPAGYIIRHTCDNPRCCNPAHLIAGTDADNAHDRAARGRGVYHYAHKTHCKHGHALPPTPNKRGERVCNMCRSQRVRQHYARKKLAGKVTPPKRTHCTYGHELTADNVSLSGGRWRCLACRRQGGRYFAAQSPGRSTS